MEYRIRICFEIVWIRFKYVRNWFRIWFDFEDGKSPHDELRTNSSSSLFGICRWDDNGEVFCRELLFIGDGECAICLRVLFGLKRFFDNDGSYKYGNHLDLLEMSICLLFF